MSMIFIASSDRMQRLVKDMRISVGTGVVIAFGNIARVELNYVWPLKKCANDKYTLFFVLFSYYTTCY